MHQNISSRNKTVIIIDPLSDESGFRTQSSKLLNDAGYNVTYFSGEDVTIEFLKNIPSQCDLYIFRVHSTCINNRTWVFTGEKYRAGSYPLLQLADLIHKAKPSLGSSYYFAVSPEFIQQYNRDSFKDGTILMMGCEGLDTDDLAEAFCLEGAAIYVSWDGNVCLQHTDQAFLAILESLCKNRSTIIESIEYAKTHVGRDPVYYSSLNYYAREHGSRKVS